MSQHDVIVIGGGAAGLLCAITAARRGRRVIVLEGSKRIGKKILMSGGGRCNFTNLNCDPRHFLSENPRFCISALSRYTPWDFLAAVNSHAIPYHEKTAGQLFCDRSSKDIVTMLQSECDAAGVTIVTQSGIQAVRRDNLYFIVASEQGTFRSESLVVASGGLSIPKMGASDFGYRLARQFGLNVVETRAGLVPFTLSGAMQALGAGLTGVSLPVDLRCAQTAFSDHLLFTHRGISGPAALQLSSYWKPGLPVVVNLLPDCDTTEVLLSAKKQGSKNILRTVLARHLPRALVTALQDILWPDIVNTPIGDVADNSLRDLAARLSAWSVTPSGTEGYRTAEVTLGGVDTSALSSQTMEVRSHPGLFFVGEVVDVTGQLGGFNFQWAWASGAAAGRVA